MEAQRHYLQVRKPSQSNTQYFLNGLVARNLTLSYIAYKCDIDIFKLRRILLGNPDSLSEAEFGRMLDYYCYCNYFNK